MEVPGHPEPLPERAQDLPQFRVGVVEKAGQPLRVPLPVLLQQPPYRADAAAMWRRVRDARDLDTNCPYSYLLWCRDFAATSVVARDGATLCGFVSGPWTSPSKCAEDSK